MIGTLDFSKKEAVVIGGGISGLLISNRLLELGFQIELHESSNRLGGLIQTLELENGIAETAAHSFLASEAVRALCTQLDVELAEVNENSRSRFIFRDGRARKVPLYFFEIISTFLRAYFVRATRAYDPSNMSLEKWGERFIGKAALNYGLNPFLRGIYASRPSELTISAAFPALKIRLGNSLLSEFLFRRKKSKRRAKMVAPLKGVQSLCLALEKNIRAHSQAKVFLNSKIETWPDKPNVIVCTEAQSAAKLFEGQDHELALKLSQIPYSPLVSVTAFLHRAHATSKTGVGVLVPENQNLRCLGILFNSSAFKNRVKDEKHFQSYTLMFGGSADPRAVERTDDEIARDVKTAFRQILNLNCEPKELKISKWPRAIPQYGSALENMWKVAREGFFSKPGRMLFGNYSGQVSIRGMIETVSEVRSQESISKEERS